MTRQFPNLYIGVVHPPKEVGEVQFRNSNMDVVCYLQTGPAFFGIVEGFGKTNEEAEADAWRRYDELRAKRRAEAA